MEKKEAAHKGAAMRFLRIMFFISMIKVFLVIAVTVYAFQFFKN